MRVLSFITLCKVLILTTLLVSQSKAETATSGNLLPNAGAGQSNYQNQTDAFSPDKVGNGQGFTVDSGIQSFANELEAKRLEEERLKELAALEKKKKALALEMENDAWEEVDKETKDNEVKKKPVKVENPGGR